MILKCAPELARPRPIATDRGHKVRHLDTYMRMITQRRGPMPVKGLELRSVICR